MTQTHTDRSGMNGHRPRADEELARALIDDVLLDQPTYAVAPGDIGTYGAKLRTITDIRKRAGREAAKRAIDDLKANDPVFQKLYPSKMEMQQNTYVPPLPPDMYVSDKNLEEQIKTYSRWLYTYIQYSARFSPEAHPLFHVACGLWVLAVAAARRIQVPLADPLITPLALVMVARSTLFAKTTTAKAALKLIRAAGLGFLLGADETTPQKLLHKMAGHLPPNFGDLTEEKKAAVERRIAFAGQIGWYYDEFNQLLNSMTRPGPMAEFAGLLRKMDNCPDTYSYETKSGEDYIEKPYLPLLASTTPANLSKHATKGAEFWNDGLLARMLFVCPEPHSFTTQTMEEGIIEPPPGLVSALEGCNEQLGIPKCHITEEDDENGKGTGHYTITIEKALPVTNLAMDRGVMEAFSRYRVALRNITKDLPHSDLDGSYGRLPTLALRIAALIASLEHNNRISRHSVI